MSATHQTASPTAPTFQPAERSRWLMLAILLGGQFMAILDVTIVNVAMPTMGTDLDASGASLQLIVSGYTISYAVLLITGARLGTMYGRRRLFLGGVVGFTVASLACGLAPTTFALILARFVQGAAAAVMVPQVISVINARFEGTARVRALSGYTAVLAVGSLAGQVLGGVLVSADLFGLDWRLVFLVNVPVGVAIAIATLRLVPADRPDDGQRRIDVAGLALVAPAVLLLVVPLVLGHELDWPAWAFPAIAAGLVLAVGFVVVERRVITRGGDPLLDLRVLRSPGLPIGLLTIVAGMVVFGAFIFTMSIHLQAGLGDSALRTGLTFAPSGVAFGFVSLTWARLPERMHHAITSVGLVLAAIALLVLIADLHGGGRGGVGLYVVLGLIGLGLGGAFGAMVTHALINVPPRSAADASGLLTTTVQLSQVIGVAVFGSVFLSLSERPADDASAHAVSVTLGLLAAVLAAGTIGGAFLGRTVLRARRAALATA
jgi:EmrB/QacA subfamily drug resistance transporter